MFNRLPTGMAVCGWGCLVVCPTHHYRTFTEPWSAEAKSKEE
jgi:hypothetical protein